jgi:NADH-quinone oxidoreductase subunit L
VVALAGIALAAANYRNVARRRRWSPSTAPDPRLLRLLFDKWRWDELYDAVVVRPFRNLSDWLWRVVDEGIIDGAVDGVAAGIGGVSQRSATSRPGLVANYALAIASGWW